MSRRINYREHPDPEHQRWGRKYPRFPGVPECVRLIKEHKARGTWADLIAFELADHAGECYEELVGTFRAESHEDVRLYIMMALELAVRPDMTPFLVEVLQCGDPRLVPYAERALRAIDTREARAALWNARHQEEHRGGASHNNMFDTTAFERATDPILRFFTVEQAREIVNYKGDVKLRRRIPPASGVGSIPGGGGRVALGRLFERVALHQGGTAARHGG